MKFRIDIDNESYALDLRQKGSDSEYTITGVDEHAGLASVIQVMPGVFSILLDSRSVTVRVAQNGEALEIWSGNRRHSASVMDVRNRSGRGKRSGAAGPVELRAQMPGKVIKLLVEPKEAVQAGQGLVVIEAMKMQNEVKSPKDGVVSRILVVEGGTVSAGEALVVVE